MTTPKHDALMELILAFEDDRDPLVLFLSLLSCADSSGYCTHVRLVAAWLDIFPAERANAAIKKLADAGYIEVHKAPDDFGTRTDAQIKKWEVRPASLLERVPWTEWKAIRDRVLERDGFKCAYCGALGGPGIELEVDHVTPLSKGGTHEMSNLVTACGDCNLSKHGKALKDWKGRKSVSSMETKR
jgi:hypothetical protein